MLRIDLHIHSYHSKDSMMSLQTIIKNLQERGLNCLALTDHNAIDGALEMEKMAPLKVIVGEEIRTREGEIIGLFLKEKIPPRLSPEETVDRIKTQGGLVYIPHPFDRWRGSRITFDALERIRKKVDIMEVFNARNLHSSDNLKAEEYAMNYNISMGVGSDSHITCELGSCYVEIQDFSSPEGLMDALMSGRRVSNLSSPFVHFGSAYVRLKKKLGKIFRR